MSQRRHLLTDLSHALHRNLLWFLLGSYAAASLLPAPGLWLKDCPLAKLALFGEPFSVTPPMLLLALLLLNGGLAVQTSCPRHLLRTSPALLAGLAANLALPVACVLLLSQAMRPWHEPDEAQDILLGLAVIASMPVAGSSAAWSQNGNGDMALSLGLVIFSTLLSPLTTPVALHAVGVAATGPTAGDLHRLAAGGTGAFLTVCVALPSLLGILGRRVVGGGRVDSARPVLKLANCLDLLLLNYVNAAASLPQALGQPDWDFLAVTLGIALTLCIVIFASGWWLGGLLGAGTPQRTSLMFGLGMNNNGSGLVLAGLALAGHPRALLPIIFYNLVQHLVAGGATLLLCRGPADQPAAQSEPLQGANNLPDPVAGAARYGNMNPFSSEVVFPPAGPGG